MFGCLFVRLQSPPDEADVTIEADALSMLNKNDVPHVPRLVCRVGDTLLISPVGKRLEKWELHHCMELLDSLVAAHGLGVVHRDVRPSNVVEVSDGSALLIDWGCSATIGKSALFSGGLQYASDSALDAMARGVEYTPCAEDDLVSLVRSVYLMTAGQEGSSACLRLRKCTSAGSIRSFWSDVRGASPALRMLEWAALGGGDVLRSALAGLYGRS